MATRFLVINQHGDNRGDEAAMKGLFAALRSRVPDSDITVLHQFADPKSAIDYERVDYLPLRLPIPEALRLSLWALLRRVGAAPRSLLGPLGLQIVEAYARADLVISAPGGPYFGDLYANHEAVHWFYAWLARLHRKPLCLYQPSAGPLRNRLLNPLRRRGFGWFRFLSAREQISVGHLESFTGREVHLGSDSALQQSVEPVDPSPWFDDGTPRTQPIVTATFRDPGPDGREMHDDAVVDALIQVGDAGRTVLLLPQLHGPRHRDQPYLEKLAVRARRRGGSVVVVPEDLSSDEQRGLVAASDFVLAGRYHPLVFAVSAGVAAVTIPYEHKASGFAASAGLSDYVVDPADLDGDRLSIAISQLIERLDEVRATVRDRSPELRQSAEAISDQVVALVGTTTEGAASCT
ncbi:polysaccharide pyruvyl transferase family protein [Rhabdothermincola salaria]|uniref:polysaccharide pyruvyl transferase family protein n=1 Tax=Rhabdothermincola salaria TaxID=2903142 RepID=UPI001E3DF0F6|nr:polysaccharide pyruvyl transferase family protein [Rhabdothermincola salaria]MCD9623387.1 polysaccharide pyruvyl transferase family protein [Rhabdothermincola salaria]